MNESLQTLERHQEQTMTEIPTISKIHTYTVQLDLRVISLSSKEQPLLSFHSEESKVLQAIWKEQIIFSGMHLDLV